MLVDLEMFSSSAQQIILTQMTHHIPAEGAHEPHFIEEGRTQEMKWISQGWRQWWDW